MSFTKTAAVAALVVAAAFSTSMTSASAHGKKHFHLHHFHHHHQFYSPVIVIGSPHYGCKHWLKHYKATGKKVFLKKYYACKY